MANNPYMTAGIEDDITWRDQAACAGHPNPDLWFAPRGTFQLEQARNICADCPVRTMCLADALEIPESDDWGMLGGLDEWERKRLRKVTA